MARHSVRALIIHDGSMLFIKEERSEIGTYYALPGGAQEADETLEEALRRECREELGLEIAAGQLVCVREYISRNHEYSFIMKEVHAIDYMFECSVVHDLDHSEQEASHADVGQIGVEWLPVEQISQSLQQQVGGLIRLPVAAYRFPLTTEQFLYEYLVAQHPVEPYKSEVFGR
ncbi:NUDIX domain-containing protein [Paenibacillus sp. PR3]|uniref:NUDIX domain-containing protein n=1 Tax=Paenibacillus terricola TaxID=2763503 RepID=A0ABR8N5R8_9BACL|nr:NUDIX domain-containing protein [Paenibacillus terricola]MBD3922184.1 NUDIX domain-containing protein [Paenibacillus terricola]